MKVTFFIDRPVFSAVISIVIVIVGIIGLTMLPVDQYPQITPPVVKISASYPGASALTVSQAVATPIEQEINGTPGMLYMESNSSNSGGFSATVTFDVSYLYFTICWIFCQVFLENFRRNLGEMICFHNFF